MVNGVDTCGESPGLHLESTMSERVICMGTVLNSQTYITEVLSTQLACLIHWSLQHHRVILEVLNSLGSVQILKERE